MAHVAHCRCIHKPTISTTLAEQPGKTLELDHATVNWPLNTVSIETMGLWESSSPVEVVPGGVDTLGVHGTSSDRGCRPAGPRNSHSTSSTQPAKTCAKATARCCIGRLRFYLPDACNITQGAALRQTPHRVPEPTRRSQQRLTTTHGARLSGLCKKAAGRVNQPLIAKV